MATKLYLRATQAITGHGITGENSAAQPNGSLGLSPTLAVRDLSTVAGTSQTSVSAAHNNETGVHRDGLWGIWVAKLNGTDITAQTWTLAFTSSESNSNADTYMNVSIYVWRAGTGVIGYVFDTHEGTGGGNREFGSATITGDVSTIAGGAVTVDDGDFLVVELWHHWLHTMAAGYTSTSFFDGATDPTDNSTTGNTDVAAYISTPQDDILRVDATVTPPVIAAVAAVPTPTAETGADTTPPVIAAVATTPTPTAETGADTTPPVIAAVATVPTPTAQTGADVTPPAIAAVATVPTPEAAEAAIVTPPTIAAVGAVNTPTAETGLDTTPPVIPAVAAMFTPTFSEFFPPPSPSDTPLSIEGILGCTEAYDVYVTDRAGRELLVTLPFTDGTWERVDSATSTATVSLKGVSGSEVSDCCALLEGVDAWANELHIYRNAARVWAGPITNMELDDDGVTIRASDISAWWGERRIHNTQNHDHIDLAEIFAAYVSDAMSVDNVPGVTVAVNPVGRYGTRKVKARDRKIAMGEIDEVARSGLRWTVLDRTVLVGHTQDPVALVDNHIRTGAKVTVDGRMATEVSVMGAARAEGRPQVVGVANTADTTILDRYGVHERVVSEDRIKDNESADVAADRRLARWERPAALFTGGALEDTFPLTIDQLVPGSLVDASLLQQCRTVAGRYRITKVGGSFGPATDSITIDVQPPGRQNI